MTRGRRRPGTGGRDTKGRHRQAKPVAGSAEAPAIAQLALPFQLLERSTFERFVVGANGELVERLRKRPSRFACCWLFGGTGVGKTHLLQAVCHNRPRASDIRAGEVDPADESAAADASLRAYAQFECVAIDDVMRWIGNRAAEVALFHLYNQLLASGGELLLTADRSPLELNFALRDLASRFGAAACYRVAPLRDEDKAQLLASIAHQRGLQLSEDVVGYLLARVARDQRHLLEILDRLDRSSLAAQRRITIPFVRDVLCI